MGLFKLKQVKALSSGEENVFYKHLLFKKLICGDLNVGEHGVLIEPDTLKYTKTGVIKARVDEFNKKDLVLVTSCNVFLLERLK